MQTVKDSWEVADQTGIILTANSCDADCILAKFRVIIKHAIDLLRSIIKKLLLTRRVYRMSDKRSLAIIEGKVRITQNVKVINKCNGCIARRISL